MQRWSSRTMSSHRHGPVAEHVTSPRTVTEDSGFDPKGGALHGSQRRMPHVVGAHRPEVPIPFVNHRHDDRPVMCPRGLPHRAGLGRRRPHEDGQEVGHPGVHYRHLRAGGQTRAEPSRSTRWGVASLQWQGSFKPVAVGTCPNALTSVRVRSYLSTVRRRDSGTAIGRPGSRPDRGFASNDH